MVFVSWGHLVGDLIYSLCACKAHNETYFNGEPFDFYLFHKPHTTWHGMNPERAASIRSLLITQPYINDVIWTEEQKDSNVNGFRNHHGYPTIAHACCACLGVDLSFPDIPWMFMEDKTDCDVIINRTQRYKNNFDYSKVLDKYGSRCQFIGFEYEWQDFTRDFGFCQWAQTKNLLEVGKLINGCKVFVGNQSSSLAIATALGKRLICEVCRYIPNCIFNRQNAQYAWNETIELPDI